MDSACHCSFVVRRSEMKNMISFGCFQNQKRVRQIKNNVAGYLFITPFIIGIFVFTLYPFVSSLYFSFTDYNGFSEPEWIGLKNYIEMFTKDKKFWTSLWVTIKFTVVQVPTKLAFSLLVAVLLSKKTKLTNIYRTIFYVPSLIGGGVAVALTWRQIWNMDGVINTILQKFGIAPVNWLNSTSLALYVLVLLGVWQFGSQMIIFLAAINDVPSELHEAAKLDGASSITRFFKITLPMITPALFFNLVQAIINSLQAFNSAYLITSGGPLNSTLYYGLYQYRQAFEYMNMGYASAMAWFLMIMVVALTALTFRSSSGWVYYKDEL